MLTTQKSWYAYSMLLYLCLHSVLLKANDCTQNQCDYSFSLNRAGDYLANVSLPDDGQAGIVGLTFSATEQGDSHINFQQLGSADDTSVTANSGEGILFQAISTGSIAHKASNIVHWVVFSFTEPQKLTLIPHNYSDNNQAILAALYHIVDGERVAFYEPTLMDSEKIHITPILETGRYIAEIDTIANQASVGLDIQGSNLLLESIGGWSEPSTEDTFISFNFAKPSTAQLSLLFSDNYQTDDGQTVGASKPALELEFVNTDGEREAIWQDLTSKNFDAAKQEVTTSQDLEIIQELEQLLGKKLLRLQELKDESLGYTVNAKQEVTGLNLYNCNLTSIPQQVLRLKNLRTLYLIQNNLKSLPLLGLSQLTDLTTLSLSYNDFETIPQSIAQLKKLSSLSFVYNDIQTLTPSVIEHLSKLTMLDLSGNIIKVLPPEIKYLENVTNLQLWGNLLETLPPEIGQLKNLKTLNVADSQLTSLPPEIGQLDNLRELNVAGNFLTKLPRSIYDLHPDCEVISINNLLHTSSAVGNGELSVINSLERLIGEPLQEVSTSKQQYDRGQFGLDDNNNIIGLNLSGYNLTEIPTFVLSLQKLAYLSVAQNQLQQLPITIGQLRNLTALDVSNNQLTSLPKEIGLLYNLTWLDVSFNQLHTLAAVLGQLQSLQTLLADHNQLSVLPVEIGQLQNLQVLQLHNNLLQTLPKEMGNLNAELDLLVDDNPLHTPPFEIAEQGIPTIRAYFSPPPPNNAIEVIQQLEQAIGKTLKQTSLNKVTGRRYHYALDTEGNITGLNLSRLDLTEIPSVIFYLEQLSVLSLSHNEIAQWPTQMDQLSNLTELDLSYNQLSTLPAEIPLVKLQVLNLSHNNIQALPQSLEPLSRLEELYLSYNQISSLPAEMVQLQNLRFLDLYHNQLKTFPVEITALHSLIGLYLAQNQLESLSPKIGQLQNLRVLWLQNNQLRTLPRNLANLSDTLTLWIWNNPLETPALEVAEQGISAIRDYFSVE
ncbi:leucine-rich repeat domain-containing protein [Candidatus Albibeggiatoa sp. nov. NOAA]|uniref:leucine-rich repeat domain-containing protein n=1 Tax=Candidatus Albibeggiatoa sp. nov. NOAA TaxID=3162724 RepID=UPI0032F92DEF|nr:leucine-rich repeat domain-containing protein [Thiotrichaceae bacterium]